MINTKGFMKGIIIVIFSICSSLIITSCNQNHNEDKYFSNIISYIENDPYKYLSNANISTNYISNHKEATDFLLYSLAQYYIDEDSLPSRELILKCIQIFNKENMFQRELEAMYILSEIYKKEDDINSAITIIEDAIQKANRINDETWIFHLYFYLSRMYINQYNIRKFVKYQTLANQCIKDIESQDLSLLTQIIIIKNLLFLNKIQIGYEKLIELEKNISKNNAFYKEIKMLQGISLYKMQKLNSSIGIMEELLTKESSNRHRFVCHSILFYCYYKKQDLKNAERHKNLTVKYESPNISSFDKIEFYTFCVEQAQNIQNEKEQLKWLIVLNNEYKDIVNHVNNKSLDKAIESYTNKLEKRQFRKEVIIYKYVVFGLLVVLCIGLIIYIKKRKKQVLEYLSMQRQIENLENLRNVKDEVKNFIFRDFEIAKKIAILRATQQVQSAKFLKDLERYDIIINNDLLTTHWEQFYKHIDFSFDDFYTKLKNKYPILNEKEIQLCCMLLSGFKTEEIAAIWMNSIFSVHKYKTNVRKKIEAPEGADIIVFLTKKLSLQ